MSLFRWLENSALGLWVRESTWGFPISLIVHVWSLAFVAGISLLMALSVFGLAPRLRPPLLRRFLPVTWAAFGISLLSGVTLLATYPDTVLGNAVFYVKLVLITVALALAVSLKHACSALPVPEAGPLPLALRLRAAALLLAWFGAIVTGRLLYYTY